MFIQKQRLLDLEDNLKNARFDILELERAVRDSKQDSIRDRTKLDETSRILLLLMEHLKLVRLFRDSAYIAKDKGVK
ncbi:MAG: hypothetical protein V3R78_09970 [Thermodesulfobacteriota bacterium]